MSAAYFKPNVFFIIYHLGCANYNLATIVSTPGMHREDAVGIFTDSLLPGVCVSVVMVICPSGEVYHAEG